MTLKTWIHRIVISGISTLTSFLLATIDILLTSNSLDNKIFYPSTFFLVFAKYIPISILVYLLFKEINHITNKSANPIDFILKEEGIVFIKNLNVWICLMETNSIFEIQINELNQLKHLLKFSIELNLNNFYLRLFIFSKTYGELKEIISKNKAILDNILPNVKPVPNPMIIRFFKGNKTLKFNNKLLQAEDGNFLIVKSACNTEELPKTYNSLILSFNSSLKEKKAQIYLFDNYRYPKFFQFLDNSLSNIRLFNKGFLSYHELQRIRIRYQIESFPKTSLKEAIIQLSRGLSLSKNKTHFDLINLKDQKIILSDVQKGSVDNKTPLQLIETKEIINKVISDVILEGKTSQQVITNKRKKIKKNSLVSSSLLSNEDSKIELSSKNDSISSLNGINQICYELCSITRNSEINDEEKIKQCRIRSSFCQKLLNNENFMTLMKKILNQKSREDKDYFVKELMKHFSFQQLICIIAHYTQINSQEISIKQILSLIHILLESNIKEYQDSELDKNLSSLLLNNKKHIEISSPSSITTP